MEFTDQLNRLISIDKTPTRIVSVVPSQTELLVDLGLENALVGITKFCVHPHHLRHCIAVVGGTKQVHCEGIKALQPDLILCNKEENTKEMIQELEKIAPVHISDINTLDDALELIRCYGELFSKEDIACKIIEGISAKKIEFDEFIKSKPTKSVAYFIWKKPWMVVGQDTFIDEMIRLNGFENYYGHLERYPEVHLKTAPPETADLVFLSSEPFPFAEKHQPAIEAYFPKASIIIVDGEMFSWYGSRLLKAFDYFKTLHQ